MSTFSEIVAGLSLPFEVVAAAGTCYGERDTLRFSFDLGRIRGEWSCGNAVPLRAYLEDPGPFRGLGFGGRDFRRKAAGMHRAVSVDESDARRKIRKAYRPAVSDIVASLLIDDESIEGYDDWLDWAEGMGADDLRKARADFATIQERGPVLRRLLGVRFSELSRLAWEM